MTVLAQSQGADDVEHGLLRVFEYVRHFDFPSRAEFLDDVQALGHLEGVALVLGGVAFLLFGFKYFKFLVVANAAAFGALVGMYLGVLSGSQNLPVLLGLAGAVLLGALAFPLVKYSVCVMGALAGGVIGLGGWSFAADVLARQGLHQHAWAGGLIGMVVVGMLAWVAFRAAVMIFTSVQGAVMIVAGACAVLLTYAGIRDSIQTELTDNAYLLNLLIAVPGALGFAYQHTREAAKIHKKRRATEKPPI